MQRATKRKTLATHISRVMLFVIGVSLIAAMGQHYRFSSQVIEDEIDANLHRISSLIQNQFDYYLNLRQIQQDRNASSETVSNYVITERYERLDQYFFNLEESTPQSVPDIRFIVSDNTLVWEDGNALFYGLDRTLLMTLASRIAYSYDWYGLVGQSATRQHHVLMRRAPMIENDTGRVIGQLYIVQVLDDAYSLVSSLKRASETDDVLLSAGNKSIAHTLNIQSKYSEHELLKINHGETLKGEFVAALTLLKIGGEYSSLTAISMQKNQSAQQLLANMQQNLASVLLVLLALLFLSRHYFHRKIARELDSLMSYTSDATEKYSSTPFQGSNIEEFDHIGQVLEQTFERLTERDRYFQDLFNHSPSLVVVWDGELNVVQVNPAAEIELRITDSECHVYDEFLGVMKLYIVRATRGEFLTELHVPIGETIFRWNISPIFIDGRLQSIIAQGLDVSSLVDAEKQSQKARIAAENAVNTQAEFVARVSHEIRTPLNGILGVSQLLSHSVKRADHIEQVKMLSSSSQHLLQVLNDILDYSKMEQGKFNIEFSEFIFSDVVSTVQHIFAPLCAEKALTFKVTNSIAENVSVISDIVRIKQILINLLSNALKFTKEGEISVSFSIVKNGENQPNYLSVEVKDSGIGIEASRMDTIFEPFVQAETTTTREYGGSGLGLTIVKTLVEMLGGTISAKSTQGHGTQFDLSFPVELGSQMSVEALDNLTAPIDYDIFAKSLKVLIVEDNNTNAFIAQAFCEKYGMKVTRAQDGNSAIECVAKDVFDLILMDNQLPGIGGIDITRELRQAHGVTTPIFAFTADSTSATRDAFVEAGAAYVLVKPIQESSFHEALLFLQRHFQQVSV